MTTAVVQTIELRNSTLYNDIIEQNT